MIDYIISTIIQVIFIGIAMLIVIVGALAWIKISIDLFRWYILGEDD